jgi:hypothetical protein
MNRRAPQPAAAGQFVGLEGADAERAIAEEQQRRETRRSVGNIPWRFYIKEKGDEKEIIILDKWFLSDVPGEGGTLVVEHDIWAEDPSTGQKSKTTELCRKVVPGRHCEFCAMGGMEGKPKRRFILTCYELTPWVKRDTGEAFPGSRRLLAIPEGAKGIFLQLQETARAQGHTMRGMILKMKRGFGDTDYAIGEPQIFTDTGTMYQLYSEEDLLADYGNVELRSTQDPSKVIRHANEDVRALNYRAVFVLPPAPITPGPRRTSVPEVLPGSQQEVQQHSEDADEIDYGDQQTASATQAPAAPPAAVPARRQPPPRTNGVPARPAPQTGVQAPAPAPAAAQSSAPARRRSAPGAAPAVAVPAAAPAHRGPVRRRVVPPNDGAAFQGD